MNQLLEIQADKYEGRFKVYKMPEHIYNNLKNAVLMSIGREDFNIHSKEEVLQRHNDQSTDWHKMYYKNFDEHVDVAWLRFVEWLRSIVGEPIVYQALPTFRVHGVNNVGVGEFHFDSDYGHSNWEENIWIPFTGAWGNNGVWVESEPNKADYHPVEVPEGYFLHFNGAELKHGNYLNDTGTVRVSFDARIAPLRKYQNNEKMSINGVKKFVIGDYFKEI